MPGKKKIVMIIILVLLLILFAYLIVTFIVPKTKAFAPDIKTKTQAGRNTPNQIESNFASLFSNIDYSKETQSVVSTAYDYKNEKEDEFEVDVHIPKINFETCEDINKEILTNFGSKLLDIVNNETALTKYKVDYITFSNGGIISLIIRCVLKEGDNPQRVMIDTYNYDVSNEKIITLDEVISNKNLDVEKIQTHITNIIRKKNENTQGYEGQGYNIYERDLNSDMYEVSNIKYFFIDEDGLVYVIFPYGNKVFTETMDVIRIN